jgi:hypothetical protein
MQDPLHDLVTHLIYEFLGSQILYLLLNEYDNTAPVRGKVFDYLRTHRLNELLNHVEDFAL